jgi:hypothetical protein
MREAQLPQHRSDDRRASGFDDDQLVGGAVDVGGGADERAGSVFSSMSGLIFPEGGRV